MGDERLRVLVLGLDGGTWDVLDVMMSRGLMPNLSSLVENGLRADLTSTIPPMTPPAWASFQTGMHPGSHRVIDFHLYRPGSRRVRPVDRLSVDGRSLWRWMSDWGGTVCVVNVPMTFPAEPVRGCLISGFDSPKGSPAMYYPGGLREELASGHFPTGYDHMSFDRGGIEGFVNELIKAMRSQIDIVLELMPSRPWDLFMYQFQFVDHLQHRAWQAIDSNDPRHKSCGEREKKAVETFFSELDRHIGNLTKAAGLETDVILLSDHGFGPLYKMFNLNQWLVQRGDLVPNWAFPFWFLLNKGIRLFNRISKNLGMSFRLEQVLRKGPETLVHRVDFDRSQAFAIPTGVPFTGVYLIEKNIKKREDYLRRLESELVTLTDLESNARLVKRIYHRNEIFSGKHRDEMPDLMIEMTDGYEADTTTSLDAGPAFKPGRNTGIHRMNGIIAMAGPHIRRRGSLGAPHITDVAPTILELLGFPIPVEMEGRPLRESILPTPRRAIVDKGTPVRDERDPTRSLGNEDETMADQLRALGYLD